jgi:hypothetical protein
MRLLVIFVVVVENFRQIFERKILNYFVVHTENYIFLFNLISAADAVVEKIMMNFFGVGGEF